MSEVKIRNIFNQIAPVYDNINDWLSFGQHHIWKEMTVKWSKAKPGDIALDICCGSGDITKKLAAKVGKIGQVYGVDFAQEMLAIARTKQQNSYYYNYDIQWIKADVLNLPFADNYFNCVTMGYGLRNVSNIPQCLTEINRVLKPGSMAAILDFHKPDNLIMTEFQKWYLQNLVVPIAEQFGVKEEYAYINPSLDRFPIGLKQVELAYQVGFNHAIHYPLIGGMMGVLVITK